MTDETDEKCAGYDVCIPTPGVPMAERCCDNASIWKKLCMPNFLGCFSGLMKSTPEPQPFFGKESKPSGFILVVMGLQHMLAMLVGVITPPRLIANEGCLLGRDTELCSITPYLICSALLASGLLSILQIMRVKLCNGYYFGTGLISVMGPSFTFLPIGQAMVQEATLDFSGTGPTGIEMYGKFLGTCIVAAIVEIALSFLPPKIIRKICPPIVSGVVVFCIGMALTGTGIKYWGGGVFCSQNMMSRPMEGAANGNRFIMGPQSCMADNGGERGSANAGEVRVGFAPAQMQGYDAPFGDPTFVAYGALAILIFTLIAVFGSPFLKSTNIAISFLLTYAISATAKFSDVTAFDPGAGRLGTFEQKLVTGMFNNYVSDKAPVSFLWNGIADKEGFKLGFAPEYLLPLMIAFFVSTAESIGDITATSEASKEPTTGPVIAQRIQGGLLADGVNSILACLFLTPPNTTFSQNTGVISITNCASRAAGFACCAWLILAGLFVPFGAFLADAPTCVLGGIVTILFSSIMVSGIKILGSCARTTRNHLIMSISLGCAVGVATVPHMLQGGGLAAFYGGTVYKLNTGFIPYRHCCKSGTEVYFSAMFPNGDYFASTDLPTPAPAGMNSAANGLHRGAYLMGPADWVRSCEIDKSKKAWYLTFMLIFNTPYCIGFVMAVLLNLILPEDAEDKAKEEAAEAVEVVDKMSPIEVESSQA